MMTWGRSNHAFSILYLVTCLTACEGASTQSMSPTEMDAGQNTAVGGSTSRAAGQAVADDTTIAGTDSQGQNTGGTTAAPGGEVSDPIAGIPSDPAGGEVAHSGGQPGCVPSEESCNGQDDDCDGVVDEDSQDASMPCETGRLGACSDGMTTCTDGAIVCETNAMPSDDVCDGIDNDCDGETDESFMPQPCETGESGRCSEGVTECIDGETPCIAVQQMRPESCNDIDDDCDGKTMRPLWTWASVRLYERSGNLCQGLTSAMRVGVA